MATDGSRAFGSRRNFTKQQVWFQTPLLTHPIRVHPWFLLHGLSRTHAVGNRELRSAVPVGQRFQPVHELTNANTKRFGQTNVHFPVPTALQAGTGRMPVLPSTASFRLRTGASSLRSLTRSPRHPSMRPLPTARWRPGSGAPAGRLQTIRSPHSPLRRGRTSAPTSAS